MVFANMCPLFLSLQIRHWVHEKIGSKEMTQITPFAVTSICKYVIQVVIYTGTGRIRIIRNGSLQRLWFELSGFYELKYMF